MFSMYILSYKLFGSRLGAVISSLFYIFNFFFTIDRHIYPVVFGIFFIPPIFLCYCVIVDSIKQRRSIFRESLIFAVSLYVIIIFLWFNLAILAVILVSLVGFILYLFVTNSSIWKLLITHLILSVMLRLPLISWLIYYNYAYLNVSSTSLDLVQGTNWTWTHARLTLQNILKLDGSWAFEKYWAEPYVQFFKEPFIQFSGYVPFALALVSLVIASVLRRRDLKLVIFYLMMILAVVIFLTNTESPLGKFMYDWIPLMFLIREPYTKLMVPMVFFISLLGYAISNIWLLSCRRPLKSVNLRIKNMPFSISPDLARIFLVVAFIFLLVSAFANGSMLIGKTHFLSMIIPSYRNSTILVKCS